MVANIIGESIISEAITVESNTKIYEPVHHIRKQVKTEKVYKWNIVWFNVLGFAYLYVGAIYGMFIYFFVISWKSFFWGLYLLIIGTLGATAGAHRLWTHRTYKAKLPLQILLTYFQATCYQNSIYEWARDHRMHHKFTDTDADPHNASRGFFFSHVGWLMVRKHKDIINKGKVIYMKDLESNPVVMFQKKYFAIILPLFCFIIPAVVPWYFWGESFSNAWYSVTIFRYVINVNGTWLVNSAAHLYGMRPYDKNILPRENTFVGYIGMGEGWHNYHHTFPWDYKASEFNGYLANLTTGFIDVMAKIGWAYDLKSVPDEMIRKRMLRTGDGLKLPASTEESVVTSESHVWGWEDEEMSKEDIRDTTRYYANDK